MSITPTGRWASTESSGDVFSIRMSPDNSWVGCALSDGQVSLHSYTTGRLSYSLEQSADHFATTSLRFNKKAPKTFIAVSSEGIISQWSTHKGTKMWSIQEENNQIYAMDLSPECDKFATAGLDKKVRLYDYEKQQIVSTLARNDFDEDSGHTNRIFSVLFQDQNTLISAGWDDTVQFWDLRSGRSVRSLFGVHACSDTLDINGHFLVTGSWRTNNQVQFWDLRNYRESKSLSWEGERQCLVYAVRFHPSGRFVAAGGSGANEVRLISTSTFKTIGSPLTFDSSVSSLSFSNNGKELLVGTQKGIHCFELREL